MNGTQRDQAVQGTRSPKAALRCVLLAPRKDSVPPDLTRSLEARDAHVLETDSVYEALATLIDLNRSARDLKSSPILLLIEPDQHRERCAELARAVQLYVPKTRIWRHAPDQSPALAAYILPEEPTESEQVAAIRSEMRSNESPYDRTRRESAPPSLRLVTDDDASPRAQTHVSGNSEAAPDAVPDDGDSGDGLLTSDELEMLMDPIFEPKPRRGGGGTEH